jgi:hypothetical protein
MLRRAVPLSSVNSTRRVGSSGTRLVLADSPSDECSGGGVCERAAPRWSTHCCVLRHTAASASISSGIVAIVASGSALTSCSTAPSSAVVHARSSASCAADSPSPPTPAPPRGLTGADLSSGTTLAEMTLGDVCGNERDAAADVDANARGAGDDLVSIARPDGAAAGDVAPGATSNEDAVASGCVGAWPDGGGGVFGNTALMLVGGGDASSLSSSLLTTVAAPPAARAVAAPSCADWRPTWVQRHCRRCRCSTPAR